MADFILIFYGAELTECCLTGVTNRETRILSAGELPPRWQGAGRVSGPQVRRKGDVHGI